MASIQDIFGSDSDSSDDEVGATGGDSGTPGGVASRESKVDVDKLFESDEDDEPPLPSAAPSRLKKRRPSSGKKRAKKRSRPAADAPAGSGDGNDGQTAYDSGAEAVENDEDRNFVASDDDLEDVRREYDQETQQFHDEEGYDEDDVDTQKKSKKKSRGGGKAGPDKLSAEDTKDVNNPIIKAVKATKR